jgi:hypothetical protein
MYQLRNKIQLLAIGIKHFVFLCFAVMSFVAVSQQNLVPIHSFYKDHLFANKGIESYNEGSFFPVNESKYNLIPIINDSSKQFYKFTNVLFKKYLVELRGKDFYFKLSPAIDFSIGIDLSDTVSRTLFQNSKGIHVEGSLFENFSFSTSLYENQGRYANYETAYYTSLGELYPSDSTYGRQNAVIPGGGRTKPFKGDGFDYAYAIGYLVYAPFKFLSVTAGNNSQFIGDGHRSLLLSDNSYSAPYFRIDWDIHPKFSFSYMRSRHMNLMRRPATGSVESYYEAKGYSLNYFTYKPTRKIAISLFESGEWNRGDSLTSKHSHPLYYNPVPFLSGLALKDKNEVVSLLGLNIGYQVGKLHRLYAQVALNDYDTKKLGFQIGYRGYNYFGLKDFMLQAEYNYTSSNLYQSNNPRLNASHFNMPLAHVKGNGFQEIILRSNYEIKRVYAEVTAVYYLLANYSSTSLLPTYDAQTLASNNVFYASVEVGYRFNRKMNFSVFGNYTFRTIDYPSMLTTNQLNIGVRTGFINHYKDF